MLQSMISIQTSSVFLFLLMINSCGLQNDTDKSTERPLLSKDAVISSENIPKLRTIVDEIEKNNCVASSHIGFAGSPSSQWTRYEQLEKVATVEQLVKLTNHKNPTVRCYAFEALVAKNSDKVFNILLDHLHDMASVSTLSGCLGWGESVGNYYISVIARKNSNKKAFNLSDKQKETLDSILQKDKSDKLYNKILLK
ncbi:MAG: hypothetical protein HYZ54_14380 [Ignavibacteriae bacterium]|nr:hypothetical protein [Ignavibacteriota bacterium]